MSQVSCEQEKTLGLLQRSNTCILPLSCCSARMQAGGGAQPTSTAALTAIQSLKRAINSSSPAVFIRAPSR